MNPEKSFYIAKPHTQKPASKCTVFVDGTAGRDFRDGIDFELSHWIPNRTPKQYKAGTSTEICFNFLDDQGTDIYDLVMNNHIDIDGLLSVFVLAYPSEALRYREILCTVSKAGDFWAWSESKALQIFQDLTVFYETLLKQKVDLQVIFEKCFKLLIEMLRSPEKRSEAHTILQEQFELIEQGKIQRHEVSPHLVAYFVPHTLSMGKLDAFLEVPKFNELISPRLAFWPQVRNRLDGDKLQLLAIEAPNGIHYDVWYPGYVWADTKGLWRPQGLRLPETAGGFQAINSPELEKIIQELNKIEMNGGWQLFPGLQFSKQENPRPFPVIATTTKTSRLRVQTVMRSFQTLPLTNELKDYKDIE